MKTKFHLNMELRISKNSCGSDRFTKEQIIKAFFDGEAYVDKHCLCRKADGKVFAEIIND